jgi:hypothetical protein
LELVQPKLDRWLILKSIDDLSLVKDSPRAAELLKVVREQSGKLFRRAPDFRIRQGLL